MRTTKPNYLVLSASALAFLVVLYSVLALVYQSPSPVDIACLALGRSVSIDSILVRASVRQLASRDSSLSGVTGDSEIYLDLLVEGRNNVAASLASLDSVQITDIASAKQIRGTTWIHYKDDSSHRFDRHGVLAPGMHPFAALVTTYLWFGKSEDRRNVETSLLDRKLAVRVFFDRGAFVGPLSYGPMSYLTSFDSVWKSCEVSDEEIRAAMRKITPIVCGEFELSLDTLKNYIMSADAAVRLRQKRIELKFVHPDVDSILSRGNLDIYLKGFPYHFEVFYFPATKRVELTWEATPNQLRMAKAVTIPFLHKTLTDIPPDSLGIYKIKHWSHVADGKKQIVLQFYHPEHFPDWERMTGVMGGYPYYFSVTVDVKSKKVIGLYNFQF